MNVILDHDRAVLLHGDCRDIPEILPDNSVDAIICDPPYLLANASGTGFMGRDWDSVKLEPGETVGTASERWHRTWAARALRVLKPGGHLLAFGGSRTFHRMCSGIEDVGFDLRDVMFWCYGSGFPKSLDVSKMVDKSDAASERRRRALAFTAWIRSLGLSSSLLNEITGTNMGSHYITDKEQPQIATREHLDAITAWCRANMPGFSWGSVPDEIEELVGRREVLSEQFAMREVIDIVEMPDTTVVRPGFTGAVHSGDAAGTTRDVAITEPYTEAAKKWKGWGTALKPAYEPIAVARKPLDGTVAGNVLEWGVGGINVDACRVEARWPANIMMDEISGAILEAQKEGAARFFYCPKPSKAEKEAGLDHLPIVSGSDITGREEGSAGILNPRAGAGARGGARNIHVTVKPVALMRYLCKLVTPPGGTVLDVFAGSGTTGVAALAEGYNFIGVEMGGDDNSHLPILFSRIRHALGLPPEPYPPPAR